MIHAGYAREITPIPKRYHRPYIHLHSRLVTKTGQIVFVEMASLVGDDITVAGVTSAVPWKNTTPRKYFFLARYSPQDDPGPLADHREKAIEGLNASMMPVARAVVAGLKR